MKILYKSLARSLLTTTLIFFSIALFCTLLFDYALKSNITDTNIWYFYSLALVRLEHILPFSFILAMSSLIYDLKQKNWVHLLACMTINKYKIYSFFCIASLFHLLLLLTFYQLTYARAKEYLDFSRFNNIKTEQNLKCIKLDWESILVYTQKNQDILKNAYILQANRNALFCPNLLVLKNQSVGTNVSEFKPQSKELFRVHKQYIFKNIYQDLFNQQASHLKISQNVPIFKAACFLLGKKDDALFNKIDIQSSLVQKFLLLILPSLSIPFILSHINHAKSTRVSCYFLSSFLFFITLLGSKIYSFLLQNYLINTLTPLFCILPTIVIYFIIKNRIIKKPKRIKIYEKNTAMLHKTP